MSEPKITLAEVEKVARLARLALEENELRATQQDLSTILKYVEELDGLDLDGVEPTFHAVPMAAALRPDRPGQCLDRELALSQAPESEAGGFAVPKVLEGDS